MRVLLVFDDLLVVGLDHNWLEVEEKQTCFWGVVHCCTDRGGHHCLDAALVDVVGLEEVQVLHIDHREELVSLSVVSESCTLVEVAKCFDPLPSVPPARAQHAYDMSVYARRGRAITYAGRASGL